jgi:hypothetical protein
VFFFLFLKSKPSLSLASKSISLQQPNIHTIDFTLHRDYNVLVAASRHSWVKPVASVPTTNAVGVV